MKKNDIAKLKTMSEGELAKGVASAKEELRTMKFELASGKVKNAGAIRELRRKIARMMTFAAINKK